MTPTPKCQFVPFENPEEVQQEIEMMTDILARFQEWGRYFGIRNCIWPLIRTMTKLGREGLMPTQTVSVWER
jgi:hypothetical protein